MSDKYSQCQSIGYWVDDTFWSKSSPADADVSSLWH